ncbi:MAG: YbjN domain-containing protein [Pseudomonadota bacterium]
MSLFEHFLDSDDLHPIDMVETLATHHDWDFDRVADDQIAMAIEGQWRTYSITLAWSGYDETLRMICTFDMEPPDGALPKLYEVLNHANDRCWAGAFSYWRDQKLMVYRYGLVLAGEQMASHDQIACMVETAVLASERYYPAFQLACWGDRSARDAMQVAIAESYGRA